MVPDPTIADLQAWVHRLRNPTEPPTDDKDYMKLHLEDGHTYQITVYLLATDMLWKEVDRYRAKMNISKQTNQEHIVLTVRGCPVNAYTPIGKTFLQNGDTIYLSQATAFMFPGHMHENPNQDHPLLQLSPTDYKGDKYRHYHGELTLKMELQVRLNFENFWPHFPPVYLKARALEYTPIEQVRDAVLKLTQVGRRDIRLLHNGKDIHEGKIQNYLDHNEQKNIEFDVVRELLGGGEVPPIRYNTRDLSMAPFQVPEEGIRLYVYDAHENFKVDCYCDPDTRLGFVLEFIQDHVQLNLDFEIQGETVKDTELVGDQKTTTIAEGRGYCQIKATPLSRRPDYDDETRFQGHMYFTTINVGRDGVEGVVREIVPFGAKLSKYVRIRSQYPWYRSKVGDVDVMLAPYKPEFCLDGKLIVGDPLMASLQIGTKSVLVSNIHQERIGNKFEINHLCRWNEADYDCDEPVKKEGYMNLDFKVEDSEFRFNISPTTQFGTIIDWLFQERGINIYLHQNGVPLDPYTTPQDKDMTGTVLIEAGTLWRENFHWPFYSKHIIVGFEIFVNEPKLGPVTVLAPGGAPIDSAIASTLRRRIRHTQTRLILDGERLRHLLPARELEIDSYGCIDLVEEQVGGGPTTGGHGEEESEQSSASSEPPTRFVPEAATGTKRKEPDTRTVPHLMFNPPASSTSGSVPGFAPYQTQFASSQQTFGAQGTANMGSNNPMEGCITPATSLVPRPNPFCGKGVLNFFEKYEAWCNKCRVPPSSRFNDLCFFLSDDERHDILGYAKKLPEWRLRDYEGVKADLIRTFEEPEQTKYTIMDLQHLVETQARAEINDLQTLIRYSFTFKDIANTLLKYSMITDQQYKDMYMMGLGRKLREQMLRRNNETRRRDPNPSFSTIEADARKIFEPESYYERFEQRTALEEARQRNPGQYVQPVMNPSSYQRHGTEATIKEVTDILRDLSINVNRLTEHQGTNTRGTWQPSGGKAVSFTASNDNRNYSRQNYGPGQNGYGGYGSQGGYGQIGYSHQAQQTTATGGDRRPSRPPTPTAIGGGRPPATPYRGDPNRQATSSDQTRQEGCHYCGQAGHAKWNCDLFKEHLRKGIFTVGPDGKMYAPDGTALPWRKFQMNSVAIAKYDDLQNAKSGVTPVGGSYSAVNVHEIDWNQYEEHDDDDEEYNFAMEDHDDYSYAEDALRETLHEWETNNAHATDYEAEVYAAEKRALEEGAGIQNAAQAQPKKTRREIIRVQPTRIAQAAAGTNTMRPPPGFVPPRPPLAQLPQAQVRTTEPVRVEAMEEDDELEEVQTPATKTRKPQQYGLTSKVERMYSTQEAVERVLNKSMVSFSIGEALSLNPNLARGVTQAIARKRTKLQGPQLEANEESFVNNNVSFVKAPGPYYSHGLPIIQTKIGGEYVHALVDSGSELDLITPATAERCRLTQRTDGDFRVSGISQESESLQGVCEHVILNLGGIARDIHMWMKPMKYEAILGMPTIMRFRLALVPDTTGTLWIKVQSDTGRKVRLLAVESYHPRNVVEIEDRYGKRRRNQNHPRKAIVEEEPDTTDSDNDE